MSKLSSERVEMPIRDICAYKNIKGPWLNYALIGTLIAVFAYQILVLKDSTTLYMLNWNLVLAGEWWRLITHIFLHANLWQWFIPVHLVSNIYFLWLFGDNTEDWFGRNKFLRFAFIPMFLVWGITAGMAFGVTQPEVYALGASGAISGVMGFYFIMYPYAQIDMLSLKVIPVNKWEDLQEIWNSRVVYTVSAYYYLFGWFGAQFVAWWYATGEPVAFMAHIAGFIVGCITAVGCKLVTKDKISSEFIQKLMDSIKELIKKISGGEKKWENQKDNQKW